MKDGERVPRKASAAIKVCGRRQPLSAGWVFILLLSLVYAFSLAGKLMSLLVRVRMEHWPELFSGFRWLSIPPIGKSRASYKIIMMII